ncbi:MAG: amino acid adenylation domain-containing protein [Phenylobacterium sp.]|nr:MAG: amino acid adenylation domain-containing protein [Phenylobacterium sp.]
MMGRLELWPPMDPHALTTTVRLEQLFARQAALTPDAPAIVFGGKALPYGDLAAKVDRLALDFARHGCGPGVLVAVSLQRTPAMVAVLLAILKAGGAYLPLDARYPPQRTGFVLSDSGAALLVTDSASAAAPGFAGNVLELTAAGLVQRDYQAAPGPSGPADLAYLIYTSGSTGTPKGVMLGHGATHLVEWARRAYAADDLARVAATTSICFDPSIFEIFTPLATGGALILKANALEPFAPDERPTLLDTVPSVLAELCRADAIPDSVRVLNVGGETLKAELAREAYRGRRGLTLYNHYGPTEATTVATVARVPRTLKGDPPLGHPVRDAEIVLLGEGGQAVADGEVGEIHIGGPGLALGYLNQPDLTAQRFVQSPRGRLYRTGDLGAWRDGELCFAGRTDQQVKIRGHRIELGEVEAAMLRIARVEEAVALVVERPGRSQVVAYVQAPPSLTPADVRERLAAWLPDYMLPARVVVMRALPRLVSGKVDRAALREPEGALQDAAARPSRREKPIIHVFQEVLARRVVGPEDSFFDLGGDSLSSVQAALRLEEVFGCELPAALIHQSPTPRALARAIEHARVRPDRHISLLQPGRPAPPLFCVADLFGQPFNYLSLARRLGGDRAVYGLAPGPLQDAFVRDRDVARLTRGFMAELRALRPHGPYLIAGYSAGGMLAADLACALEREGETVILILLDANLHSSRPSPRAVARWALQQARTLLDLRRLPARSRGAARLIGKLAAQLAPGAPPDWIPASQVAFAAALIRLGARYRPAAFSGPTLLVKATNHDPIDQLFDADGLMGWSAALKGEVAAARVRGDHHDLMREPAVAETALAVSRFLTAVA